jgi:hypothetical protein
LGMVRGVERRNYARCASGCQHVHVHDMVPHIINDFPGVIFVFDLLPFVEIEERFFCYGVTRRR